MLKSAAYVASAVLMCAGTSVAQHSTSLSSFGKKELQRRSDNVREAQKQAVIGDTAYEMKDFKTAYESYKKGLSLLPRATVTRENRYALAQRMVQSAIAWSKRLESNGQLKEAKALLNEVLDESVAPGHPDARTRLSQLNDPIRSNPAVTLQHAKDVENVRMLLYKAQGLVNLADFDRAALVYEDILRIDKYNTAARRGLEAVNSYKSDYFRSAYDELRSRALSEVDESWSTNTNTISDSLLARLNQQNITEGYAESLEDKLSGIIIPNFDAEDATLESVLPVLRDLSRRFNVKETDPRKKEVNIILDLGDRDNLAEAGENIIKQKFTLKLRNIPFNALLDYVCAQTGTAWEAGEYSIKIIPTQFITERMITREFRTPTNFLSDAETASTSEGADPFLSIDGGSAVQVKVGVQQYLENRDVSFPEGSSVNYIKSSGRLFVKNTKRNVQLIETLIENLAKQQDTLVVIKLKIIDITESTFEELGFDNLLAPASIGSELFLSGGSPGSGTAINSVSGGAAGASLLGATGVTSGLRSGEGAFGSGSSVDGLIASAFATPQTDQALLRSPAIAQGTFVNGNTIFQTILRGLDQSTDESRIFTPSVVTRSGQQAIIEVVREFPYPLEYDPPQIPNTVNPTSSGGPGTVTTLPITPATPTSFDTEDLGTFVEVEPVVDESKNYITLTISPRIVEFDGFINYGSPIDAIGTDINGTTTTQTVLSNDNLQPIFSRITTQTQSVLVQDGSTVAIAALTRVEVQQINDKVPILGDLPFVGRFFQNNGNETIKRKVVILVSADIVDVTGKLWRDR